MHNKAHFEALRTVEAFLIAAVDYSHTAAVLEDALFWQQKDLRPFPLERPLGVLIQFHIAQTVAEGLEQ